MVLMGIYLPCLRKTTQSPCSNINGLPSCFCNFEAITVDPTVKDYILGPEYKVFRIVSTVIYYYLFIFLDLLKIDCF